MSCCGLQTVRTRFIHVSVLPCARCAPEDIDCKPRHRTASSLFECGGSGQPTRAGCGVEPGHPDRLLRLVERLFPMLPDVPAVYLQWRQLVVTFGVSGVQVHDARLVAAMRVHGVMSYPHF